MRIGTWNMEGKGTPRHVSFLQRLNCDVLLLTEVPHDLDLGAGTLVTSKPEMGPGKEWSAVWTKEPTSAVTAPHALTAASQLGGVLFVSTVLPWNLAGSHRYWKGREGDPASWTRAALAEIAPLLRSHPGGVVFGGDFNHALEGHPVAGTNAGRDAINELLETLRLSVPTRSLPHREPRFSSIDHIALPTGWKSAPAVHKIAHDETGTVRLSDHDAYIVEATPTP